MKLVEVKEILSNKITNLNKQRAQAVEAGDLATVGLLDISLVETQTTLDQISSLPNVE